MEEWGGEGLNSWRKEKSSLFLFLAPKYFLQADLPSLGLKSL